MMTAIEPGASFLRSLMDGFRSAISRQKEMQCLDSQEIGLIARELNLTVAELNALAFASSRSVGSLNKRLEHAGICVDKLAALHGDVLRDLRRVCGLCPFKPRCARDVGGEQRPTPSKYCPNEQTLRALSCEVSQRPSAGIFALPD